MKMCYTVFETLALLEDVMESESFILINYLWAVIIYLNIACAHTFLIVMHT